MGGQACVFYGAAEFSRDTDLAVVATAQECINLTNALRELQADRIAVPPFELPYLERGHAVHFRSRHPEAEGQRIDIMAKMRGVRPFELLWQDRTTIRSPGGLEIDLLGVADLVAAKKTQRDKDWPMIAALVEANYQQHTADPTPERVQFWLLEARSYDLIVHLADRFSEQWESATPARPAIQKPNDRNFTESALAAERNEIVTLDRAYWAPLRKELEQLRRRPDVPRISPV